ncbi:MAG TPA: tetratricopeptide repeat protein [Thermoanaerobaculia bacterium]|nr:tetratricopeptide repeat protein [Thermoanaerobaculia bacterium]
MSSEPFPFYRFGPIEIDARKRSVRRGTDELQLRQQAFEVLLYLIQNRSRVVSKTEMFETIWAGAAVTEDALVQCIVDIRKAVGDDRREPWFLRTVPKKGYRIIAEPAEISTVETRTLELEDIRSLDIEIIDETPPDATSRYALAVGIAAIVLAGVLAVAFLRRPAPPAFAPIPTVAVMPFEGTAPADLAWMRDGIADMLITDLAGSKELNVIPRQQLFERSRRTLPSDRAMALASARELARASSANRMITGRFTKVGEKIRIDAQLHDTTSGELIAAENVITARETLLEDVDALARALAARLGARPVDERHLTDIMTGNLDAYRYYSIGVGHALTLHHDEAIEMLEKAIELDPAFAMAWARIGYVHAITWIDAEKARPYFAKALSFPDRLDQRERLNIAGWDAIARLDYASAIQHFRAIVASYPTETEGYLRLAYLLGGELRFDEAIRVLRAGLVVDQMAPELHNAIGAFYAALGNHVQAIAAHKRYVDLLPNEPNAYDSLGLSYQRAGRLDEAIAQYRRALELDPQFKIAAIHLGNTWYQMGRCRDAIRELERYLAITPLSEFERSRGYASLAGVYRRLGDLQRAETLGRQAMLLHSANSATLFHVHLLSGDLSAAGAMRKNLDEPSPLTARGRRPNLRAAFYVRALYAAKMGNEEEAIDYARKAMQYEAPYYDLDPFEDALANILMILGRVPEAVAEYERAVKANPALGMLRYELAVAYQKVGRASDAQRELDAFLSLWEGADSDIPELADARRRREGKHQLVSRASR